MSNCQGCDPQCFESTHDKCVSYTGPDSKELGIEKPSNLGQVIETLIPIIEESKKSLESCGACGNSSTSDNNVNSDDNVAITSNIQCLQTSSYVEFPENFEVKTTPKNSSIQIDYDLNTGIPNNCGILRSSVNLVKNDGTEIRTSGNLKDLFNVSPDSFPATLNSEVKINGDNGVETISTSVQLRSEENTTTSCFISSNPIRKSESSGTQKEVNETFDREICNLNNKISQFVGQDVLGVINELKGRISELESLLNDVGSLKFTYTDPCDECGVTTKVSTIQEAFNKQAKCCCDNTSQIQSNNNQIGTIKNEYNVISTIGTGTGTNTGTNGGGGGTTGTIDRYDCVNGACIRSATGTFDGINECISGCSGTPPVDEVYTQCQPIIQYSAGISCGISLDPSAVASSISSSLGSEYNPLISAGTYTQTGACVVQIDIICGDNTKQFIGDSQSTIDAAVSWIEQFCPCDSIVDPTDPCDGTISITTSYTSSLEVVINGGVGPYTYYLNGAQTPYPLDNPLTQGNYSVKVIDDNGCESNTSNFIVGEDLCSGVTCSDCRECNNGECQILIEGQYVTTRFEATARCVELFGDTFNYSFDSCSCIDTFDPCNTNCTLTLSNQFAENLGANTQAEVSVNCGDCSGTNLTANIGGNIVIGSCISGIATFVSTVPTPSDPSLGISWSISAEGCNNSIINGNINISNG